jgi:NTE family protein
MARSKVRQSEDRNQADDREQVVLVLQGGGALGSYQAGVFEALAEAGHDPDWIAGISIGAVNAALIAGNPPERRARGCASSGNRRPRASPSLAFRGRLGRRVFNEAAATVALTGIPGFFAPRLTPPWLALPGSPEAISLYDTAPLRQTLLDLVDFDLLNEGPTRFSVGAVNVLTGNFAYFDNHDRLIEPEHIMASGALPPGFPPVMIDGEPYWDGGIVSNTPLQYVLDERNGRPLLVFQVDLFSARGLMPRTLAKPRSAGRTSAIPAVPGSTPTCRSGSRRSKPPPRGWRTSCRRTCVTIPTWRCCAPIRATAPSPSCISSTGARITKRRARTMNFRA